MSYALVLMYHRLGNHGRFSVMPDDLKWQISNLKSRGFRFVFAEDIPKWRADQGKICALTFDDGYLDNMELKNIDVPVTIFVATNPDMDEMGGDGAEFDPERLVRELSRFSNVRFGSHGITHKKWTKLSHNGLISELVESKRQIEEWSGQPIRICAYPKGSTNPDVTAAISDVYDCAFLADGGPIRSGLSDKYSIPRVGIFGETPHLMFRFRTSVLFDYAITIWKKLKRQQAY